MPDFLYAGPTDARATLLFTHGAGAPMDTPWMDAIADGLAAHGIRSARFEFAYMAARRQGQRKPPPRAELVMDEYRAAVAAVADAGKLFIGGKSMGGRVASMVADELFAAGRIAGLVCLGYPFHPPGKLENLRTAHLEALRTPALICQGERDPFGTAEEVAHYRLSPAITLHWLADGDHDLKPRKASGLSFAGHVASTTATIAEWMDGVLSDRT